MTICAAKLAKSEDYASSVFFGKHMKITFVMTKYTKKYAAQFNKALTQALQKHVPIFNKHLHSDFVPPVLIIMFFFVFVFFISN